MSYLDRENLINYLYKFLGQCRFQTYVIQFYLNEDKRSFFPSF